MHIYLFLRLKKKQNKKQFIQKTYTLLLSGLVLVLLMNGATGEAMLRVEPSTPFWCVPHTDTVDTDFSGNESCKQPWKSV